MVKLESDLVKNILFKPYIDAANTASKQAADSQLQAKSLQTKVDSLTAQLKQAQGPDQNQLKSLLQALQNSEKAIQSFVK
jgi:Glu-tRNA(Gln) amidotransferase subunit E-like FAD-binding protein